MEKPKIENKIYYCYYEYPYDAVFKKPKKKIKYKFVDKV